MRLWRMSICVLFLITMSVAIASADSIYNNGLPNGVNGNEMTQWIQAEDFILPTSSVLTDIRFWNLQNEDSYQGSIVWRIYSDNAGNPGSVLFSGTVAPVRTSYPGANCCGYNSGYQNDFSVGSIGLDGGTKYWLGLHNGNLAFYQRSDFYWSTTVINSTQTGHEDATPFDSGGWSPNGQEHAFQLFGTGGETAIPEPTTLLLLASGLVGIGLLRRRK
jgi:hypothetical protein